MRLLDLFCGAGGAAMGYHRAGFEVVGVDVNPQPSYPFEFHQYDAMELLPLNYEGWFGDLGQFDAVHASPPCQRYSPISRYQRVADNYPDLMAAVRGLLGRTGLPWVIENVPAAPMRKDAVLCGQMFGLPLYRHRAFEANFPLVAPEEPEHPHATRQSWSGYQTLDKGVITVVGHTFRITEGRIAMEMPWAKTRKELAEAIPPAYTEFIGHQLMEHLSG